MLVVALKFSQDVKNCTAPSSNKGGQMYLNKKRIFPLVTYLGCSKEVAEGGVSVLVNLNYRSAA